MTNLSTLIPGFACFVEMRGKVFPAVVVRQFENEQVVQVQTDAATLIRPRWKCMSFRWQDGKADACRWDGRLILDQGEALEITATASILNTPAPESEFEPQMPPELTSYVEPVRDYWWND